jgi:hypothetical protein
MIIVLETMIKETAIFFLLLTVIAAGFLQSFLAYKIWHCVITHGSLESSSVESMSLSQVLNSMTQAVLSSPSFDLYEALRPPFGIGLFYIYTSIVMVCTYQFCLHC